MEAFGFDVENGTTANLLTGDNLNKTIEYS
jgi:hypothetical protein